MNLFKQIVCLLCVLICAVKSYGAESGDIDFRLGTIRSGLRFGCEVPLANITTNAVTTGSSLLKAAQHILKTKGVSGFYSGGSMEALRGLIWYPRMELLKNGPRLFENKGFSPNSASHLTALSIATMEAAINPILRVRTALMAETKDIVRCGRPEILRTLHRGTGLRFLPNLLSWDVYLLSQGYARKYYPNSLLMSTLCTTGPQMMLGFLSSPFYVVLFNQQKLTDPCKLPFFSAVRYYYAQHGSRIFVQNGIMGAVIMAVSTVITVLVTNYNHNK